MTPSPCISVCKIDGDGLCKGCLRTIDEIRHSDEIEKLAVWQKIAERLLSF